MAGRSHVESAAGTPLLPLAIVKEALLLHPVF